MNKILLSILISLMTVAIVACGAAEEKPLDNAATNVESPSDLPEASEEEIPETTETDIEIDAETETEIVTDAVTETLVTVIEAKNCFDDAGFIELIAEFNEPTEYTFTAENSEAVEWSVYILDEAFDDNFRYIKQVTEPVLLGDGTIFIDEGQYVYIYCSANEFTTGVADENAKLKITVK